MVGCFIDIKAAFDSVDRRKLSEMEKKGVSAGLKERIREMYKETICKVRLKGEVGEEFGQQGE